MSTLLARILMAAVVAVLAVAPAATAAAPARLFSPQGPWNAALRDDARLSPRSDDYVAQLRSQVSSYGPWINTGTYSTPVYTVPAHQRRVAVTLDADDARLARAFTAVPIPEGATPAVGTDRHMVVWQPARDTVWEFWHARRAADGWHAAWGGVMRHVSRDRGWFPAPYGATATGLPLLAGLMRISELQAGHIDHALALGIPKARRGTFVWPAQRTDGRIDAATAIPEGTRFRLDPDLDVDALAIPRSTKVIARAAQRYGMIVRDQAGSVTLYGEDPTPWGVSLKATAFDGLDGRQVLHGFPWARLQVVAPPAPRTR
jgi:hypothetical protein